MTRQGMIEIYQSHGEWRWRLKASNGKTVLQGESHPSRTKVVRAVRAAQALFPISNIVLLLAPAVPAVNVVDFPKKKAARRIAALRRRGPGRPRKKRGRGPDLKPRKRSKRRSA